MKPEHTKPVDKLVKSLLETGAAPLGEIPLSPMRFKRCGECGCPEHGGANGSGHSTACSKYDHLQSPTRGGPNMKYYDKEFQSKANVWWRTLSTNDQKAFEKKYNTIDRSRVRPSEVAEIYDHEVALTQGAA